MVLEVAGWPHTLTPLATALAALMTQIYLGFRQVYRVLDSSISDFVCHRILRLTGSRILYGIIVVLAITSFILGTICSVEATIIKVYVSRLLYLTKLITTISLSEMPRITPLVIVWLSVQVVVDTLITSMLVYPNVYDTKVLIHKH